MARSLALAAAALVAPAGAQLNILAVADWGGAECLKGGCKNPSGSVPFTTDVQLNVSTAMGVIGAQLNPSFVLALGDNFYEDGISCLNDPTPGCTTDATSHRFKDTFEKVYTAPSLQVPWWLNAGNHDWHAVANATAQLAYTHAPGTSKRWNFPAFYYSMNTTFTDASSGASLTAQFVFIDTVILCGLSVPGAKGQPVPPADADPASVQLQWLTATLAASTADWLIVAGHYPVFSVAEHGSTACLIQQVQPLLVANKVALYINGHDHNLQHLDDGTGVVYGERPSRAPRLLPSRAGRPVLSPPSPSHFPPPPPPSFFSPSLSPSPAPSGRRPGARL